MGITINEIVDRMTEEGYRLTARTVKYYIEKGLLPETEKTGGYKEGVKLLFSDENLVFSKLKKIFKLKGKGYTLSEIKIDFEKDLQVVARERHIENLKKYVQVEGRYYIDLSNSNFQEDDRMIIAKNIIEFVEKWNKISLYRESRIPNADYSQIEIRSLFHPIFYFKEKLVWREIDGTIIGNLVELHTEYDYEWDVLEKLYMKHIENSQNYLHYPEIDNVRFTEEWLGWKRSDENQDFWGELKSFLNYIRTNAFSNFRSSFDSGEASPLWDSKYDNANDFISDFLKGHCVFLRGSDGSGMQFLKRISNS